MSSPKPPIRRESGQNEVEVSGAGEKRPSLILNMFQMCKNPFSPHKDGLLMPVGLMDNNDQNANSGKIAKREQQIQLHTAQRARRGKVAAKRIDINTDVQPTVYPKEEAEIGFLDEALEENFIFAELNEKERRLLIDAMQKEVAPQGTVIIKQGDVGDFFYVVQQGVVEFTIEGVNHPVGDCTMGDSFGELALLYDAPRAATCTAVEDAVLWKVDQHTFRSLLAREAQDRADKMIGWLKKVPLFSAMNESDLNKFCDALTQIRFDRGDRIVNKGDVGDVFYIITQGQVRVHDIGIGDSQSVDMVMGKGEWFGERALITGEPRAANVTAMGDVILEATDRETFVKTFGSLKESMESTMKKRYLMSIPLFNTKQIGEQQLDQLVELLEEKKFLEGEKIAEMGKRHPQNLYIIKSGEVIVYDNLGRVFHIQTGAYYGHNSIREDVPGESEHNVEFKGNTTCWVLTRAHIESVIGDLSKTARFPNLRMGKMKETISVKDMDKHRILGCGAFGKVWLVTYQNEPYALKMLSKRQLVENDQVEGVLREKALLSTLNHPFILHLHGAFQDKEHLFLLLELVQGGELFNVIHGGPRRRGLPNNDAVFYGACVISALGHFHQRLICYRDLKPENILIDAKGYCIVVDLGFAKVVGSKTYTLCGTPEYLAPEIITSKGHDKAADYWAFGVLVYEMLVGRSPFYVKGADNIALFKNIVMVKYTTPRTVNGFAADLIKKLLVRNQAHRIGNLSRGYQDIIDHAWFDAINFEKLEKKVIDAPWLPEVKDPYDASHFDDMSDAERERPERPISDKQQRMFELF